MRLLSAVFWLCQTKIIYMIDFEKNAELLNQIANLNSLERHKLIVDLIETGKLDFVELAKFYVNLLQKRDSQKTGSINTLGLMLGMYCMTDTSRTGETARKHLYESGMYGHK